MVFRDPRAVHRPRERLAGLRSPGTGGLERLNPRYRCGGGHMRTYAPYFFLMSASGPARVSFTRASSPKCLMEAPPRSRGPPRNPPWMPAFAPCSPRTPRCAPVVVIPFHEPESAPSRWGEIVALYTFPCATRRAFHGEKERNGSANGGSSRMNTVESSGVSKPSRRVAFPRAWPPTLGWGEHPTSFGNGFAGG